MQPCASVHQASSACRFYPLHHFFLYAVYCQVPVFVHLPWGDQIPVVDSPRIFWRTCLLVAGLSFNLRRFPTFICFEIPVLLFLLRGMRMFHLFLANYSRHAGLEAPYSRRFGGRKVLLPPFFGILPAHT